MSSLTLCIWASMDPYVNAAKVRQFGTLNVEGVIRKQSPEASLRRELSWIRLI